MSPSKELISRSISNGSLGESTPRSGIKSVSGNMVVEARTHSTPGTAPEYHELMKAALGNSRTAVTKTSSDADDVGGNAYSDTIIRLADADANTYNVGDIVMTKEVVLIISARWLLLITLRDRSRLFYCKPILPEHMLTELLSRRW